MNLMKRTLVVALVALPVLLVLSFPFRGTHHGLAEVVGTALWLGFLAALLLVVVTSIALAARKVRGRRALS